MRKAILLPLFAAGLAAAFPTQARQRPDTVAWHNAQQAALHGATAAQGWHVLEGGVRFRRVAGDGSGPAPRLSDVVQVHYTGRFADGEVFDTSQGRGPASFPLRGLIRAWQIAIPYMGVGDTAEIIVPMEMGYGLRGAGPIPPGATLLFTIELLGVSAPPGA